jgi:L-seryl-tRNA(Ser) seleniumtransferase
MSIVSELGLRPIINACGPATRVGGHRMHPEVVAAIAEAAGLHFAIDELQEQAGRVIADATGAAAGFVSAGASSGLTLAAAAVLAGVDPVKIDALPFTDGMPNEILVQAGHRNAYDHALRAAGARLVDVGTQGYPGGGRTHAWQIEAAIGPQTVAIAHPHQNAPGTVPLAQVAEIAHRHGLAVIVDGAAAIPPKANLRRFIAEGADLVAYSGGKTIGGPQASGILCGRADLIRAAALQQLDMDVDQRTWRYRSMIESGQIPGPPHHGVGRSMKVGKEQIVGLLAALRRFLDADEPAEVARQTALLEHIAALLEARVGDAEWPKVILRRPPVDGRIGFPVLAVDLGGPAAADRAAAASRSLQAGDPPVYASELWLDQGQIVIIASTLTDQEAEPLVTAVLRALDDLTLDGSRPGRTSQAMVSGRS